MSFFTTKCVGGGSGAVGVSSDANTAIYFGEPTQWISIANTSCYTITSNIASTGIYNVPTKPVNYLYVYDLRVVDVSPSDILDRFVLNKKVFAKKLGDGQVDTNKVIVANSDDINKALTDYNSKNKSEITLDDVFIDLKYVENFVLKSKDE